VDFPDTVQDQRATGARFLNAVRGYSATSPADLEHYCLDCRFRDWVDATGELIATVTFTTNGGTEHVETVHSTDGTFRTDRALGNGETATIVIETPWGDTSGAPTPVK
jgi:hypothetical protein